MSMLINRLRQANLFPFSPCSLLCMLCSWFIVHLLFRPNVKCTFLELCYLKLNFNQTVSSFRRTFITLLDVLFCGSPDPSVVKLWGIKDPPRKLKAKPVESRPQPLITSLPQIAVNCCRQDTPETRKLPSPPHHRVVSFGSCSQLPQSCTFEVEEPSGAFQLSPPNKPTSLKTRSHKCKWKAHSSYCILLWSKSDTICFTH